MKILVAVQYPILREGIKKILSEESDISIEKVICQKDELFSLSVDRQCILLLDFSFSDQNEKKFLKKIIDKYSRLKVLVLGDDAIKEDVKGMMQVGASGYICKKQSIDELLLAIKKIEQGGIYLSDKTIGMLYNRPESKSESILAPADLTERESQILSLICQELTNREIAEKLSISVRTVDAHRRNLLQKTGAKNTAGLVKYAVKYQVYSLS